MSNAVLGFGKRPRLLYRVGKAERTARGRKGEPLESLKAYILRTYPNAVVIAANPVPDESAELEAVVELPRRRIPRAAAEPQGEPARLWHSPAWNPGPVREMAGAAATRHMQANPSQPRLHWEPPTPEPRRVQMPQRWRPRLWSDPATTWAVVRGGEFEFVDLSGVKDSPQSRVA